MGKKTVVISLTKERSIGTEEGKINYDPCNLGGDSSFDLNFEIQLRLDR